MAKGESYEKLEPKAEEAAEPKSGPEKKKIEDYEIQNAMRVLMEADGIKENSALMAEVKRRMKKTFTSLKEVREHAKELNLKEDEDD